MWILIVIFVIMVVGAIIKAVTAEPKKPVVSPLSEVPQADFLELSPKGGDKTGMHASDEEYPVFSKTGIFIVKDGALVPLNEYPAASNGSFDSIDRFLGYKQEDLHMISAGSAVGIGKKIELMFCPKYERIPAYVFSTQKEVGLTYKDVETALSELDWANELLLQIRLYKSL